MPSRFDRDEDYTLPALPMVSRPLRLVLAEDDGDLRALLAAELRRDGHDVIVLRDGPELATYLARATCLTPALAPADLVISDLFMPGGGACDLLSVLWSGSSAIPYVIITSFCDEETEAEALSHGAHAVLSKPFDIDDLRAIIREVAVAYG